MCLCEGFVFPKQSWFGSSSVAVAVIIIVVVVGAASGVIGAVLAPVSVLIRNVVFGAHLKLLLALARRCGQCWLREFVLACVSAFVPSRECADSCGGLRSWACLRL